MNNRTKWIIAIIGWLLIPIILIKLTRYTAHATENMAPIVHFFMWFVHVAFVFAAWAGYVLIWRNFLGYKVPEKMSNGHTIATRY